MDKTNAEAAAELIKATRQEVLRRAAMRHRGWSKVLRGFRPQALTKELALTRAGEFGAAPEVLRELAEAFLESAGIPKEGRLKERLNVAAGRTGLPDAVRDVCRQLAGEPVAVTEQAEAPVTEDSQAGVLRQAQDERAPHAVEKPTRASRRRAAKA